MNQILSRMIIKMRFATVFLILCAAIIASAERPFGSGRHVTGGNRKPRYVWTFGKDNIQDLEKKLKEGNVH